MVHGFATVSSVTVGILAAVVGVVISLMLIGMAEVGAHSLWGLSALLLICLLLVFVFAQVHVSRINRANAGIHRVRCTWTTLLSWWVTEGTGVKHFRSGASGVPIAPTSNLLIPADLTSAVA